MIDLARKKHKILIVDDQQGMRQLMQKVINSSGKECSTAKSGEEALELLEKKRFDLVVSDIKMPTMDGIELLRRIKERSADMPVILITAYASLDSTISAVREGASDYIVKPFTNDQLLISIEKALRMSSLEEDNRIMREQLHSDYGFENIIGVSRPMQEIFDVIERVSGSSASVLITGETGTGKEVVAKAIHYSGPRKDKPFIAVSCAALPETLLESELFGHEKGAFTDAIASKKGRFELANGGTLFLDEIGEVSPSMQIKLLRVLQEEEFERIGGTETIKVDVRIIAASNKDLVTGAKEGRFREDLYYRINVVPLSIPPLRERLEDVPLLIEHFLNKCKFCVENKQKKSISPEAIKALESYDWPGNVRELENTIERASVLSKSDIITIDDLPQGIVSSFTEGEFPVVGLPIELAEESMRRSYIVKTIKTIKDPQKAAEVLRMKEKDLKDLVKNLEID